MSALLGFPLRQRAGTTLARKGQAVQGGWAEGAGYGCWSQRQGVVQPGGDMFREIRQARTRVGDVIFNSTASSSDVNVCVYDSYNPE